MKLLIARACSLLIIVLSFCSTSSADVIFQIDMNLNEAGIQTTRAALPGNTFDIGLNLSITDSNTIAGFSVGVLYDVDEIDIVSVNIGSRPVGFEQVNTLVVDSLNGLIRPFDAISIGSVLDSTFSELVGVISVSVKAPITDGHLDITPVFTEPGIDGVIDGLVFQPIQFGNSPGDGGVFLEGASLVSVPEPAVAHVATALLFVTALVVVWRRRCDVAAVVSL